MDIVDPIHPRTLDIVPPTSLWQSFNGPYVCK